MTRPLLAVAFGAALIALPDAVAAQTVQQGRVPMQNRWPGDAQQLPQQSPATPPAAPGGTLASPQAKAAPAPPAPRTAEPPRVLACAGPFARDSSHAKLVAAFGADNVTYTDIKGPDGTTLKATVLYPKDPKRRLEVMWERDTSRSDTRLMAINGQSTWLAPKGLKLGLTLDAVEKLNGKPFKLSGFGKESGGSVQSWENGALATLAGNCKVGLQFAADPKTPPNQLGEVSGDKELVSSYPGVRAVNPRIEEIIVGYAGSQ